MDLSFLSNVQVAEVTKKASTGGGRSSVKHQPEESNTIRVFKSGKTYPSADLISLFNLEFQPKDSENPGNGFDIFSTSDWMQWPEGYPNLLAIAAVSKNSPKVSMFGQCTYNEDGTPKSEVAEQGGGTFGKELVEMISTVYGVNFEEHPYIDLYIADVIPGPTNGVYYLPKVVSRGAKKGAVDAVRRENIVLNALVLKEGQFDTKENVEQAEEQQPVAATQEQVVADTSTANAPEAMVEQPAAKSPAPVVEQPVVSNPVEDTASPADFQAPTGSPVIAPEQEVVTAPEVESPLQSAGVKEVTDPAASAPTPGGMPAMPEMSS